MPGVVVRFQEPGSESAPPGPEGTPPETPAIRDSAGSAPAPYQARLEERLGGRPQFERFSSQLLDGSEAVMSGPTPFGVWRRNSLPRWSAS